MYSRSFASLVLRVLLLTSSVLAGVSTSHAEETYLLKKVVIADSLEKVAEISDIAGGDANTYVEGVPVLSSPEFATAMHPFIGKPIDGELLKGVISEIGKFAHDHDRLVVKVEILNNQNITGGCLRLAVGIGRYNQLLFQGNRWFSQKLLQQKLGIKPGDEVRLSELEQAVTWMNASPFRQVQVLINQIPDQPGKADLIIGVQDSRPLKLGFTYDNDGLSILGRNRYTGSVQYGNLFGLDHQITYQFITSDQVKRYQGHVVDYVAPLPWRHNIEVTASHVKLHPSLLSYGFLGQEGQSTTADAKYRIPFGSGNQTGELSGGIAFHESNNNLEWGGYQLSSTKTDTFLGVLGFTGIRRDNKGAWLVAASVNLSPGRINSRNTDKAFQPDNEAGRTGRIGAKANYVTGTLSVQRLLNLGHGWDLFSRATGQLASTNLLGSEQFAVGGANTLRGYDMNVIAGDEGYVINNDLMSPTWKKQLYFLPKNAAPLETRLIAFYDIGEVYNHIHTRHPLTGKIEDPHMHPLASTGLGLRVNYPNHFSLVFDYGWHTTQNLRGISENGRGHVKVVLAF